MAVSSCPSHHHQHLPFSQYTDSTNRHTVTSTESTEVLIGHANNTQGTSPRFSARPPTTHKKEESVLPLSFILPLFLLVLFCDVSLCICAALGLSKYTQGTIHLVYMYTCLWVWSLRFVDWNLAGKLPMKRKS